MALKLEPGAKLVVATHNPGKARELAAILDNRFELVTAGSLGLPEPEETEATFTGNALLKAHPNDWRKRLDALRGIDWSRANAKLWEGRALIGGKVSKVTTNVMLTTNVVKQALKLPLAADETAVEKAHLKKGAA